MRALPTMLHFLTVGIYDLPQACSLIGLGVGLWKRGGGQRITVLQPPHTAVCVRVCARV